MSRTSRWITNTKLNNTQIQVQVPEYTGRTSRNDNEGVIAQTSGGVQASAQVSQAGVPEFIQGVTNTPLALPNTASPATPVVNIQFRSNSVKISASVTSGSTWLSIAGFVVNGEAATLGENIPNDPGALDAYIGGLKLQYSANTSSETRTATIRITTNGGSYVDYTVNQYGADSTITLTPNPLEFTAAGGTQIITVTSNDNWTLV